jgi:hypothetical protein
MHTFITHYVTYYLDTRISMTHVTKTLPAHASHYDT